MLITLGKLTRLSYFSGPAVVNAMIGHQGFQDKDPSFATVSKHGPYQLL